MLRNSVHRLLLPAIRRDVQQQSKRLYAPIAAMPRNRLSIVEYYGVGFGLVAILGAIPIILLFQVPKWRDKYR